MPHWWKHQDSYCSVCGWRAEPRRPGQRKHPCSECGSVSFYHDRARAAREDGTAIPKHTPGRRGPRQAEIRQADVVLLWEEFL